MCFSKCHSLNPCAVWRNLDLGDFIWLLFPSLGMVSIPEINLAAEMVASSFINGIFMIPLKCQ